jgi:hypothetical protein
MGGIIFIGLIRCLIIFIVPWVEDHLKISEV